MNLPKAIWTITGGIVFIAVLTQTRIIQNLLKIPAKTREDGRYYDSYAPMMDVVKVQPRKGWYDYYGNGYGYHDEPFQYSGTESDPRAQTDQLQEHEELAHDIYPNIIINQYLPLTEGEYPSHIKNQYIPPRYKEHKLNTHYKEQTTSTPTLVPTIPSFTYPSAHTNTLHPSTIDQYQQYYPDYTPAPTPTPTPTTKTNLILHSSI
jgi:hypothetical protein